MNNWNQNQNQNQTQNNMTMGQAQFNPYNSWNFPNSQARVFNQPLPTYHAEPIHGENAAWAFPIGGGDIWIPDADQDIIWWIRIDQNGNKQVKPFDVKPHEQPQPVDIENILSRLGALEEWVNGKQNKSNAKRNTATTTATESAGN